MQLCAVPDAVPRPEGRTTAEGSRRAGGDQLGALGLVLNMVVIWNTRYMARALDKLRAQGYEIRDEDVARLSRLIRKHINLLGRYDFDLPEAQQRGELRPLRELNGRED